MVMPRARPGSHVQLESNDAIVSRLALQDDVPWYRKPNLRLLYFLMAPTCLGVEMTTGFDSSMLNGLQAVPSWLEYYHYPRSAALGIMVAMYSLGSVVSFPFVPSVVDKFGRRYPILLGGAISIFGGILQGSALNFTMFIIARFILGFANNLCVVAAASLIGELSHPKERAFMSSLFHVSYLLGGVVAATLTLGTFAMTSNWGWRIPSLLQAFPSLLQVTLIWFVPESPRWLISKGRKSEAYTILVKYHAEGDEGSEFVKAEYTQIVETLDTELKVTHMNWNETLSTPGMRKRVVIATLLGMSIPWSGVGLISHFLSPILDSIGIHDNRTKNIANLARVSWSLVNGIVCALIVPRFPRRRIYLTSSISVFVMFSAWTIASARYSFTHGMVSAQTVLALMLLYSLPCNLGFTALNFTYLVELFPFHARARGIAIFQWAARGSGFVTQFSNPIGLSAAGWRWYIVYCVWTAFQVLFIYSLFPETSGRTLEELTFIFEGGQDAIRDAQVVEPLLQHGDAETYGTMDDHFTSRTVRSGY